MQLSDKTIKLTEESIDGFVKSAKQPVTGYTAFVQGDEPEGHEYSILGMKHDLPGCYMTLVLHVDHKIEFMLFSILHEAAYPNGAVIEVDYTPKTEISTGE